MVKAHLLKYDGSMDTKYPNSLVVENGTYFGINKYGGKINGVFSEGYIIDYGKILLLYSDNSARAWCKTTEIMVYLHNCVAYKSIVYCDSLYEWTYPDFKNGPSLFISPITDPEYCKIEEYENISSDAIVLLLRHLRKNNLEINMSSVCYGMQETFDADARTIMPLRIVRNRLADVFIICCSN